MQISSNSQMLLYSKLLKFYVPFLISFLFLLKYDTWPEYIFNRIESRVRAMRSTIILAKKKEKKIDF